MEITKEVFELIFPKGIFEYFEITEVNSDAESVTVTFTENDEPPLKDQDKDKKIIEKRFHNITVTDFALRGKSTKLIFRRRYWKIEGQVEYLKRDLKLTFPGTQLEAEFALFLKGAS